jgi:hypothetical protein
VGGPYEALESDTNTNDVIEFIANDPTSFTMTPTDPESGLTVGAHPSEFKVTWQSATTGSVFGVDTATGATDKQACGSVGLHAGAAIVFSKGNTCALDVRYSAKPYKTAANDSVLEFLADAFTITPVDPSTGVTTAAHPEGFAITWTAPTTGNIFETDFTTGKSDAKSCGTISIDPVKKTVVVTGCDSDGTYAQ